MKKILTIAGKELYTTFTNRALLLIMVLTPLALASIMALAFGGLGGGGADIFTDIPVAVVNLDEGFDLAAQLEAQGVNPEASTETSLRALELPLGDTTVNVGELLLQNGALNLDEADLDSGNVDFNMGQLLTGILLSQPISATDTVSATGFASTGFASIGFASIDFDDLTCPLVAEENEDSVFGSDATLGDLFAAESVADPAAARAGVEDGTYAAAIIIPPGFSNALMPLLQLGEGANPGAQTGTDAPDALVEVYGNAGQSIAATIVSAVVEGIVNQLMRPGVALEAVVNTGLTSLATMDLNNLDGIDPAVLASVITRTLTGELQSVDASVLEPLACLVLPDAGTITLQQQPLDPLQQRSGFAIIMVALGSAQAIFFALFTGVFGINSIYEDREQGTLQRVLVSPTPPWYILAGKLLGNVAVVAAQLLILFLAFTALSSLVEMQPIFIWGSNVPLLLLLVIAISLFASGLGVMLVGVARNTQQVQLIGPMLVTLLGALGGSFGFSLPPQIASISPVWWASNALLQLAVGEASIAQHLLVLLGLSAFFFTAGTVLFRRRLGL